MTIDSTPARALAAGAICLAILGGMIVGHAWPLWTGRTVVLSVVPIDPRDLFPGEYVRLATPANQLRLAGDASGNSAAVRPLGGGFDKPRRSSRVYVQLEPSPGGDYVPVTVSMAPVANALNLRGRVQHGSNTTLAVDYGLDAFYMQEGTARPVEDALRSGRRVQMEVAIAKSGQARIRALLVDGVRVGG